MKKYHLIFLMMLVLCLCSGCESSNKKLKENITVEQYSWVEEGIWTNYDKTGLLVKNKNDSSVDISIEVKCYDKAHNYIDTRSANIYALAPKTEYFLLCNYEDEIQKTEYTYTCKKSDYKGLVIDEDILIRRGTEYPMSVGVENLSGKKTVECNCSVIFYNQDGKIIGGDCVELHDGKVPDGETVMEEVDTPLNATGMDIFINAYI